MKLLPMTAELSRLAAKQGFDLTPLAMAEQRFNREYRELEEWVRGRRLSIEWSGK